MCVSVLSLLVGHYDDDEVKEVEEEVEEVEQLRTCRCFPRPRGTLRLPLGGSGAPLRAEGSR